MIVRIRRCSVFALVILASGCSNTSYRGIVRPTPRITALDPELASMTDVKIEFYLKSNAPPTFPTVLAVARVSSDDVDSYVSHGSGDTPLVTHRTNPDAGSIEVLQ